jgi:hypothetical protein
VPIILFGERYAIIIFLDRVFASTVLFLTIEPLFLWSDDKGIREFAVVRLPMGDSIVQIFDRYLVPYHFSVWNSYRMMR